MGGRYRNFLTLALTVFLVVGFNLSADASVRVPTKPDRFDYVFDFGGIIESKDLSIITRVGRELDDKTKAQVVVVTVDTLGGANIEEYANQLFRAWGLGDRQKNNGVLLLVNKENTLAGRPGRVRIEVGYGLEGAIPDGKAGRILDNYVLPRWGQKQYSEGIVQGFLAIAAEVAKEYNVTLDGNYAPVPMRASRKADSVPAPVIALIVAIVLMVLLSSVSRRRRRGRRDDDEFGGPGGRSGGWWGGGPFFGGGGGGFGGGGGGFGGGSSGGGGSSR